jgi:hypothetical protein
MGVGLRYVDKLDIRIIIGKYGLWNRETMGVLRGAGDPWRPKAGAFSFNRTAL